MALLDLLGQGAAPVKIGSNLIFDCVLRESHDMTNKVTEFPVEDGSSISDHIISSPRELQIEGIITNSPVSIFGGRLSEGARGTAQDGKLTGRGVNRAELAFKELERIHTSGQLVNITGRYKVYENMAMISAPVVRDPGDGDSIHFTASFRTISKVVLMTATASVSRSKIKNDMAKPKVKTGRKTPSDTVKPAKTRVSLLKSGINSGRKLLSSLVAQ